MNRGRVSRRGFLRAAGAAGVAAGVGSPLARLVHAEDAGATPRRLVVIHFPNGTVPANWLRPGEDDLTLGPVLAPFEDLRAQMVVVDGLRVVRQATPGQDHGRGMAGVMTGAEPVGPEGAALASVDQILADQSPFLRGAAFHSLQLAADVRAEPPEHLFVRVMSYADKLAPLPPEHRPEIAHRYVFGEFLPGGATVESVAVLDAARARRKSVLDFVRGDLDRLERRAPAEQRPKLERHLESIREMERALDVGRSTPPACEPGAPPTGAFTDPDRDHGAIGLAQLDVLRHALACDLARVATFMWAPGGSQVNFSSVLPVQNTSHHVITHMGLDREHDETLIGAFYAEKTAAFLRGLRDTAEGDGTLLDHTLVVFLSEMATGLHSFDGMPVVFFGGSALGLAGGRVARHPGRSINDLWCSVAEAFGVSMPRFGDPARSDGPLPGLFA